MVGRTNEVLDVGGERALGEVAAGLAQAGEVEAQHGDAVCGQGFGDPGRGVAVLAAGEAVREHGIRGRDLGREFKDCRQRRTL
nr:hypothetical protein [Streptomyces alboflavus]